MCHAYYVIIDNGKYMKLLALCCCALLFYTTSHAQTLVIGSSKFNPPFETWADHSSMMYGFDSDLMTEICKRLKVKCEFRPYAFDDLFDALKKQKVDVVISSMIITEGRKEKFLFSLPYLASNAQYFANDNSKLQDPDDLYGKKIGVRVATAYSLLVESQNRKNKIVYYDELEDMFLGLKNNEIDAAIMDYESVKYWIAITPGIYKLIGGKIPIGEGYAIMTNKGEENLIRAINRIILDIETDGTFLRIYSQYF
jgi:arginine transport system substrate-binding protein